MSRVRYASRTWTFAWTKSSTRPSAVALPVATLRPFRSFSPHAVKVMTWGGLRGGISVALALSLSGSLGAENRPLYEGIVVATYVVVIFSIGVQGATMAPLLRRYGMAAPK